MSPDGTQNQVGQHELDEVPQADLARPVERRRPDLVVRPVCDRHRDLADLLATADAMTRRLRGDEGGRHRGLACSRLARDRQPAAHLHHRPEEVGGLRADRVEVDETSECHVANCVSPKRRGQAITDGWDRRGQPSASLEDPGLDDRMLRVELPICWREQPFDYLAVLTLAGRRRQAAQPPRRVEIRHTRTLEEDLLDVGAGDQLRQRSEVGDRLQDPADHLARITEWYLVAEVRAALILVDGTMDLGLHLVEITLGSEPPSLDANEGIAADAVVGVGADSHRATTGTCPRRFAVPPFARAGDGDGGTTFVVSSATAFAYGP
jgi:hypothetical protein